MRAENAKEYTITFDGNRSEKSSIMHAVLLQEQMEKPVSESFFNGVTFLYGNRKYSDLIAVVDPY